MQLYKHLILLCTICLFCAACEKSHTPSADSPADAESTVEFESAMTGALSAFAEYQIVRPDVQHDWEVSSGIKVRKWFSEHGIALTLTTDWVDRGMTIPTDTREILIGATNRPESEKYTGTLLYGDYVCAKIGNRYVITGGSAESTIAAVDWFIDNVVSGNGTYTTGADFEYLHTVDYPLASLTIGNTPVSEMTIQFPTENPPLSGAASWLQDYLLENAGVQLEIKDYRTAGYRPKNAFLFVLDEDINGYEIAVDTAQGDLCIYASDVTNACVGLDVLYKTLSTLDDKSVKEDTVMQKGKATFRTLDYYMAHGMGDKGGRGTRENPFFTMEEVLVAITTAAEKEPAEITIHLDGGMYLLSEPISLIQNELSPHFPVRLRFVCTDSVPATFAAWIPITGFRETTVNGVPAWEADIPIVRGKMLDAHQFFTTDGTRLNRPRFPADGTELYPVGVPGLEDPFHHQWNEGANAMIYGEGDIPTLSRIDDIQVCMFHYWDDERLSISSIDESTRTITFTTTTGKALRESGTGKGAAYYLDNVYESLGKNPGEVYADRTSGKLYYVPRDGETIEHFTLFASDFEQLLYISGMDGTEDSPTVIFENIAFVGSDWKTTARRSSQAANDIPAAINLHMSSYITFQDCIFAHIGNNAVKLHTALSHITFDHCVLRDIGGGGIQIAGVNADHDNPDANLATVPHDIVIRDCLIESYGRVHRNGVGILARYLYNSEISHNEIHDGYYTAISVGWSWGYAPHATRNVLVEKNHLYDIGKGILSDMGGIYTLGLQPGTVLRGNLIHDIHSRQYGGWGIYPDEGSTGILIEDNICYNFTEQPFHQHYGKDNIVRNNIFAFGDGGAFTITRKEDHNSLTLSGNILVTRGSPIYAKAPQEYHFTDKGNLVWNYDGSPYCGNNISAADVQNAGYFRDVVIDDPCFADPDNGDFTLPSASPAITALGFTPIDISDVGIRAR